MTSGRAGPLGGGRQSVQNGQFRNRSCSHAPHGCGTHMHSRKWRSQISGPGKPVVVWQNASWALACEVGLPLSFWASVRFGHRTRSPNGRQPFGSTMAHKFTFRPKANFGNFATQHRRPISSMPGSGQERSCLTDAGPATDIREQPTLSRHFAGPCHTL